MISVIVSEPVPAPFVMVTVKRASGPPLRFRGRRIDSCETALGDGRTLSITLWERKSGGVVLSVVTLRGRTLIEDSAAHDSLTKAALWLEDVAAPAPAVVARFEQALAERVRTIDARRRFAILAGQALGQWSEHFTYS